MQESATFFLVASFLGGSLLLTAGCQEGSSHATPIPAAQAAQPAAGTPAGADRAITLYVVGQVHNATEPCGCTTEVLGDVSRVARLVKSSTSPAMLLDAGGLRYSAEPLGADRMRQARLKADFLERTWASLGAVVGLQPEDLLGGAAALAGTRRLAANVQATSEKLALVPSVLRRVGEVQVGVIGLAWQEAAWPAYIKVSDPVLAARQEEGRLRSQGAQIVVALTGMPRQAARRLGRAVPGLDVVVAGGELDQGTEDPEVIGKTLLCAPAKEAQRVVRIELHLTQGGGPLTLVQGAGGKQREETRLRGQQQLMTEQLERLRKDPQADPAFVKTTREELDRIRAALASAGKPAAPPKGSYIAMELFPVRRDLLQDPEVKRGMEELDRRIGDENLKSIKGPPPPPPKGQPSYVGLAGCIGACHWHDEAVAFWRKTIHATAWKTLVDVHKERSLDCVGCHVVGLGEPGGSNLLTLVNATSAGKGTGTGTNRGPDLRDVQCEVCHGPGSLHVAAPSKVSVPRSKPTEDRCRDCHTKDHSDTFEPQAYLRDILGPGHGEEARQALGAGKTAHELRQAALLKHKPAP